MTGQITLTVNGIQHHLDTKAADKKTLLSYLRQDLGLLGAKNGCGKGHCGTCTVIVDGQAKRSCLISVARLNGASVETIENLSRSGILHPLQSSFLRQGAVQCGFCTPGMIMAAKALLDRNPAPSAAEIKAALKHNLCRCTGYQAVILAVQEAAAVLRGETILVEEPESGSVGQSVTRKDGPAKVTGQPIYTDDMTLPGMLYGRLLFSPHAHADILDIDTTLAVKAPGVAGVFTAKDIPGRNLFGLIIPNQPVLAEKRVRYVGDPVALVLGESEAAASAALQLIQVAYQPLPGIYHPDEAKKEGAIQIHPHGNIISQTKVRRGDIQADFQAAEVVVTADFQVPFVEHAYLEPECGLSSIDEDGVLTLWSSSQGSYAFRDMIAASLDLPAEKVRVIYNPAGGAFGGKEEPTVQIHCALGSLKTGRPVKMTLSREESIRVSTKRHAETMHYQLGASADGHLVAFQADVTVDTGAYDSLGKPVVFRSGVVTAGPYQIPQVKIDSTGYYTNNPPGGAFRGFGSTQVAFAAEVTMDILARQLAMDPFRLREINALVSGAETITGQILGPGVGFLATLQAVESALAKEKGKYLPGPGRKIGIGIASAYKNVGIGAGKSDRAGAVLELSPHGEILLKVGAAEMGQGSDTVLAQMVYQVTGIPFAEIQVINNDTFQTPSGEVTTASRQTYVSGNAVIEAAAQFIRELKEILHSKMNWPEDRPASDSPADQFGILSFAPGMIRDASGQTMITWRELAENLQSRDCQLRVESLYCAPKTYPLPEHHDRRPGDDPDAFDIHFAYVFGTQAAIVECDETTGDVRVLKIIAATDVGRAINPQLIKNQVEGAVVMGLGYALTEEFVMAEGQVVTDSLAKLGLPKISDMPEIDVLIIEEAQPGGPFGAKGMGELPINPTAPAIINGIFDALGVRIFSLPATPEKIRQAIAEKNSH